MNYVVVRYGNFFQFLASIEGGHASVAFEPGANPIARAQEALRTRRMPDRGRGRQVELRAERIAWRARSRSMHRGSRSLDRRLRQMNGRAAALDMRLWHHAEASGLWHGKWDDLPRSG